MSNLADTIDNYINSSEKIIEMQSQTIAKLKETIAAKSQLHNTLVEYVQRIYDALQSTNPTIKEDAMWHLANLAYPKETK